MKIYKFISLYKECCDNKKIIKTILLGDRCSKEESENVKKWNENISVKTIIFDENSHTMEINNG
jgi:hypothetical protein